MLRRKYPGIFLNREGGAADTSHRLGVLWGIALAITGALLFLFLL